MQQGFKFQVSATMVQTVIAFDLHLLSNHVENSFQEISASFCQGCNF